MPRKMSEMRKQSDFIANLVALVKVYEARVPSIRAELSKIQRLKQAAQGDTNTNEAKKAKRARKGTK